MTEWSTEATAEPENRRFDTLRALLGNIGAGLRLAFFLRTGPDRFRQDLHQGVLAALAFAATFMSIQIAMVLPRPVFNPAGLGTLTANYSSFLLGLWLIAVLMRNRRLFLPGIIMMTLAHLPIVLMLTAAVLTSSFLLTPDQAYRADPYILICALAWAWLIARRTFRMLLDKGWWRPLVASAAYVAAIVAPAYTLPQISAWYQGYDKKDIAASPPPDPIDVERTFYAQRDLVSEALDHVAAGRPGIADLYFVGFAGYGRQDVFMKEVKAADSLFETRFDTKGRSLALINNRQTIESVPLANGSNLRLVLKGIAQRMNPDEDILFLFLTSHGSPGIVSTRFWPLQQNDLEAKDLRAMLDEAGIGWRVIVISACYSGSFVDSLSDERTLVITAARKDRTSFGCSNDADMTYFGEAFLNDGLRKTHSFMEAYDLAAKSVAAREKAEDLKPSDPQISVGAAMPAKLAGLMQRLDRLGDVAATR